MHVGIEVVVCGGGLGGDGLGEEGGWVGGEPTPPTTRSNCLGVGVVVAVWSGCGGLGGEGRWRMNRL